MKPLVERAKDLLEKRNTAYKDGSLTSRIPTWITAGDGRQYLHEIDESIEELCMAVIDAEEAFQSEDKAERDDWLERYNE